MTPRIRREGRFLVQPAEEALLKAFQEAHPDLHDSILANGHAMRKCHEWVDAHVVDVRFRRSPGKNKGAECILTTDGDGMFAFERCWNAHKAATPGSHSMNGVVEAFIRGHFSKSPGDIKKFGKLKTSASIGDAYNKLFK